MPISRIVATKRGRAAIAAVVASAMSLGGVLYATGPTGERWPAAVTGSVDKLIKPWEGLFPTAYQDIVGVWTICYGETVDVHPGDTKTPTECNEMLYRRIYRDYYVPLTKCAANFTSAPLSVQMSMVSGAYNFGTGAWCRSTAARMLRERRWREACEAQTAFNKAGGRVVRGLVNRREMGDAQRIGEAEACVSGLE